MRVVGLAEEADAAGVPAHPIVAPIKSDAAINKAIRDLKFVFCGFMRLHPFHNMIEPLLACDRHNFVSVERYFRLISAVKTFTVPTTKNELILKLSKQNIFLEYYNLSKQFL